MDKNKLILTIPQNIQKQITNNSKIKFYPYFRFNKKIKIVCLILLNLEISDKIHEKIFEKKYPTFWKKDKEYEHGIYKVKTLTSKNKITLTNKDLIEKIKKYLIGTTGLEYYYDKEIESIIIYNKGNYEQNKNIIENS